MAGSRVYPCKAFARARVRINRYDHLSGWPHSETAGFRQSAQSTAQEIRAP